jgi:hypothetical protein
MADIFGGMWVWRSVGWLAGFCAGSGVYSEAQGVDEPVGRGRIAGDGTRATVLMVSCTVFGEALAALSVSACTAYRQVWFNN